MDLFKQERGVREEVLREIGRSLKRNNILKEGEKIMDIREHIKEEGREKGRKEIMVNMMKKKIWIFLLFPKRQVSLKQQSKN